MVPTGFDELNQALGGGMSGLVEVYGDSGTGKSGVALSLSKASPVLVVDLDGSCSLYLAGLSGDPGQVTVLSYDAGESGFLQVLETAMGAFPVVIVDPSMGLPYSAWRSIVPLVSGWCNYTGGTLVLVSGLTGNGYSVIESLCGFYCQQRVMLHHGDASTRSQGVTTIQFRVTKNIFGTNGARGLLRFNTGGE